MATGSKLLVSARPHDPFIRWRVAGSDLAAVEVDGDHVGWLRISKETSEVWATSLGTDSGRVTAILAALAASMPIDGITVEDSVFSKLPPGFISPESGHWCLWTLDPAKFGARKSTAIILAPDDKRIAELLVHSNSAHVFPGDDNIVRWCGVVRGEKLLSVGAQVHSATGAAHLVSICTHPSARSAGLAREVCNALINEVIADEAPMIFLEMFAGNEPGRRVYSALGFDEVGVYRSGRLITTAAQALR
ncbi:MAG: GNAT family N-acetyltransferase [Candidatus Nanopelagicales bacterium]|nr:GNAT family N-acetyltransferase [Candidatus Nanopelagicales bacterium]